MYNYKFIEIRKFYQNHELGTFSFCFFDSLNAALLCIQLILIFVA